MRPGHESDEMSRLAYRKQGDPAAVRVYTVCDESRYLIVRNVPALGCIDELVKLFGLYGPIEGYRLLDEEDCEPFTDVYWIQFVHISNARFAKRKLDEYKFLGNLLHVSYAPEYETFSDTKEKLQERRHTVLNRINSSKHRGVQQQIVDSPVVSDPFLEPFAIPGRVQQYPKFPLQQISSKTEGIDQGMSGSSQCQNKSSIHGTPAKQMAFQLFGGVIVHWHQCCKKYFSSPSMNATVQSIREKLDKISSVPIPIGSSTASQQLVDKDDSHINSETCPTVKKPRHDNRRRI